MTENMKLAVALKRCIDCAECEGCPAFGRCNGTFDSIAHLSADLIEAQGARIAELERRTPPEADNAPVGIMMLNDALTEHMTPLCGGCQGRVGKSDLYCKHCGALLRRPPERGE